MTATAVSDGSLAEAIVRTRDWINDAVPALISAGCDRDAGGFAERFDWAGNPLDPGFRRVRVTGRQTYVLCHAALGGMTPAADMAQHGARFLIERCRRPDNQFVSRLAPDGTVLDGAADLYDIAFGLFAMAWWYRLSGQASALDVAEASIAHLEETMRSPSGRGFLAREGDDGHYQQNPHMHLFEASIFLAAFTKSVRARALADELFDLTSTYLYDPATRTLPEFFDADWRPDGGSGAVRVEPGHHYEWVWLLSRYGDMSGNSDAYAIADALFDFAYTHGHDQATGLILDAVDPAGNSLESDLRIWPNTEFLKAQVAMRERRGAAPGFDDAALSANVDRIFRFFLLPQQTGPAATLPQGLWIDYLKSPSLTPKCDHIPASTLYHIMFGFSELLRHSAGHDRFSGKPW